MASRIAIIVLSLLRFVALGLSVRYFFANDILRMHTALIGYILCWILIQELKPSPADRVIAIITHFSDSLGDMLKAIDKKEPR